MATAASGIATDTSLRWGRGGQATVRGRGPGEAAGHPTRDAGSPLPAPRTSRLGDAGSVLIFSSPQQRYGEETQSAVVQPLRGGIRVGITVSASGARAPGPCPPLLEVSLGPCSRYSSVLRPMEEM